VIARAACSSQCAPPPMRELICDLINEVQIPIARVGDPKPGVAFEGDVVRILSME
jgi:hypothetical protein